MALVGQQSIEFSESLRFSIEGIDDYPLNLQLDRVSDTEAVISGYLNQFSSAVTSGFESADFRINLDENDVELLDNSIKYATGINGAVNASLTGSIVFSAIAFPSYTNWETPLFTFGIAANSDVSLELTGKFSEDLAFNGVAFDDKNFNLDWDSSDSSEAPIITGSGFVATEDSGVYHLSDEFPGYNLVGEANEFSLVEQTGAYGGVLELETSTGSFIYKVNNQNTDVQYLNNIRYKYSTASNFFFEKVELECEKLA